MRRARWSCAGTRSDILSLARAAPGRAPHVNENDQSRATEARVRKFYDGDGWASDAAGATLDSRLWEVGAGPAAAYAQKCDRKIVAHIGAQVAGVAEGAGGSAFLDAGSGPARRADWVESYGAFQRRFCIDISRQALTLAREKLGDACEYVQASLLALPFPDDFFDASIANHVIYHIHADAQERAVRELIRTAKPGRPIVLVYRNPLAPLDALQLAYRKLGLNRLLAGGEVYFHVHRLGWWKRFQDTCEVSFHPWHVLSARFERALVPSNALGRRMYEAISAFEDRFPRAALRLWSYPLVRLEKRPPQGAQKGPQA